MTSVPKTTSWLAKAKTIYDIAPHTVLRKANEWEPEKEAIERAKWLKVSQKPSPVEPDFQRFYHSRMHDSWVMEIERTDEALRMRLDSSDAYIFAASLATVLEAEPVQSRWPVDLLLHKPSYVRAARHDKKGNLIFEDWRKISSSAALRGDEFLADWFFEEDRRLQWVAEIWCGKESVERELSAAVWLMVDCVRATAIDRRAEAIEAAYGPGACILWNEAWGPSEGGPGFKGKHWGGKELDTYLQRRIVERRLSRSSFKI